VAVKDKLTPTKQKEPVASLPDDLLLPSPTPSTPSSPATHPPSPTPLLKNATPPVSPDQWKGYDKTYDKAYNKACASPGDFTLNHCSDNFISIFLDIDAPVKFSGFVVNVYLHKPNTQAM